MKKFILHFLLILIFYGTSVFAQKPDTVWTRVYSGLRDDQGYVIFETPDGGYMIGGETESTPDGRQDLYLMKINSQGDSLWTVLYGTANINELYAGIEATADGGYILFGTQPQAPPIVYPDIWMVKTDANGILQWENRLGEDIVSERAFCGTSASDGGYIIVGDLDSLGWRHRVIVYKTDPGGNQIWRKNYFPDTISTNPEHITPTSDGGYVITGETRAFTTNLTFEIFLLKIDANGNSVWIRHYGNPGDERAYHVLETSDGGFLITGATNVGSGTGHFYLVKTDQDGVTEWTKEMIDRGCYKAIETIDGNFLITGLASQLVKIDHNNGDTLWTKFFIDSNYTSSSYDVKQTSDGGYISTGWYNGGIRVVKFTPDSDITTFSANSTNIQAPITNFQNTNHTIQINVPEQITQGYTLSGLIVSIDTVLHSATGDLEFFIDHSGVSDTLIYQVGGGGQNFFDTQLFDGAQIPISQGTPPFTGLFLPHNPLSHFVGVDPNGNWTLTIYDGVAGNVGSLEAWGLKLFFEPVSGIDFNSHKIFSEFSLDQNYPNPFNPTTTISWQLPVSSNVTLEIYNLRGQKVKTLHSAYLLSGSHSIEFDASGLASGIYYYRLEAGEYVETRKMIVLK